VKSIENLETVKVVISKRGFGKDKARKEYYRRVEERKRIKKDLLNKKDKLSEKEK
jgi:hypothetical protein